MLAPDAARLHGRRELVLVAVLLVAATRLVDRPDAFLVAGLLPAVMLVAGVAILGGMEALLVPAVIAGGAAGAIHLVPPGLGLVPYLAAVGILLDRTLALEMRLAGHPHGAHESDRARVLLLAVVAAFIGFTGIATLVPGGLAEGGGAPLEGGWLVVLAIDDALVALLLGYRVASLRHGSARVAAGSAATYAIVVAIAAGTLRAIDLPQLVAPAALTLVLYLWDALHATAPARRRDARFVWEVVLLAVLGAVVVAWNLRLAG